VFEAGYPKMLDQRADWTAHAAKCDEQARLATEEANKATSQDDRTEFLLLANEWQKLASEVRSLAMASDYR